MSYRLYRVADPCGDITDGTLLGEYDTFDAALDARDDDTAAMFGDTTPGHVLRACHQIVGPGALGHDTPHPVTSELPRPVGNRGADDVEEARQWLHHIHTPR